jgi:glycosyltransferase involved in cell wall biosynthesis
MLSFIVIGRNEGAKLARCLQSIRQTAAFCTLASYEVIYVDSDSGDNSVELAETFGEVKIFRIVGNCNAAHARNIGASEATGDIFFFIDGDIELNPDFLRMVMPDGQSLVYPFITGNLLNKIHDSDGRLIGEEPGFQNLSSPDKKTPVSGGVFLIEKKLWLTVRGMKTKYTSGEDPDLSLRLARAGTLLVRRDEFLGNHYTISYHDDKRFWNRFFSGIPFYNMVLIRDHLFNPWGYRHFLRLHFTWMYLVAMLLLTVVFRSYIPLATYIPLVLLRNLKGKRLRKHILKNSFRLVLTEVCSVFAFLFFYPRRLRSEYLKIR